MNHTLIDILRQARQVALVIDGVPCLLTPGSTHSPSCPATSSVQAVNTFRFSGSVWTLQYDGQETLLPDSVGLRYIHCLLQHQGKRVDASNLILKLHGEAVDCRREDEIIEDENGGFSIAPERRDEILSSVARRRLDEEIRTLEEEADALRASGDAEGASEKEEKIEQIQEYLRRNTVCGRSATFVTRTDRDRKSVSIAIRRTIRVIGKGKPALAWHLDNSIKTGSECSYQPERPTHWVL